MNLDEWFKEEKIPGLEGIDTRQLTIITREAGTLRAVICTDGKITPKQGVQRAKQMEWPSDSNLVSWSLLNENTKEELKDPKLHCLIGV